MDIVRIIELQRALTNPDGIWDNPNACATLEDLLQTDRLYEVGPNRHRSTIKVTSNAADGSLGSGIARCFVGFDEHGFSGFVDPYASFLHRILRQAGEGAFHDEPLFDPKMREETAVHATALGPNQIDRQMAMSTPLDVGEGMLIAGYSNGANPGQDSPAFKWLQLMAPAFSAGRKLRHEIERYETEWSASIDALPIALLVFDHAGKLLHRNRQFNLTIARHPGFEVCQPVAETLARNLSAQKRRATYMAHEPLQVTEEVQTHTARIRLSAAQAPWPFGDPICLVSVEVLTSVMDPGFTKRETDVALLLIQGMPDKQIARDLNISLHTARRHVERVLTKTGTRNRTQAAAILHKVLDPTPGVRTNTAD